MVEGERGGEGKERASKQGSKQGWVGRTGHGVLWIRDLKVRTGGYLHRGYACKQGSVMGEALALFVGILWEWVPAWSARDQSC